ncbi:MAG: hypothetical protein QOI44_368 [Actinomycetota bacterium]|nr:hypothetical protein [Actinomycetota bacterium]
MTAASQTRARGRVRVEPGPKRVRAYLGGVAVADSTRVQLVWENPNYPTYYFPMSDVRDDLLHPTGETRRSPSRGDAQLFDIRLGDRTAPGAAYRHVHSPLEELRDLVAFTWGALDHWFEEDEEVRIHARNPYTRIDVLPSSRTVRVEIDGVVVAESDHPTMLFETGLPTRYYFAKPGVRLDLLVATDSTSGCPYKGTARYWSVVIDGNEHVDFAWCYEYPLPESIRIAGMICFYNERVDLFVDGVAQTRPKTVFS